MVDKMKLKGRLTLQGYKNRHYNFDKLDPEE